MQDLERLERTTTTMSKTKQPKKKNGNRRPKPVTYSLLPATYPNDIDSKKRDIFRKKTFPLSDYGRQFIRATLNPNGKHSTAAYQVPDGSTPQSSIQLTNKQLSVTAPASKPYTIYAFQTNQIGIQAMYISDDTNGGSDEMSDTTLVALFNFFRDRGKVVSAYNKWAAINPGLKIYLLISDAFMTNVVGSTGWAKDVNAARITSRALTAQYTGTTLNNSGKITSAMFKSGCIRGTFTKLSAAEPPIPSSNWVNESRLPSFSASFLSQCDINSYTGVAKEGCYQVTCSGSNVADWVTSSDFCALAYERFDASESTLFEGIPDCVDAIYKDWREGLMIISGLSADASFNFHFRSSIEIVPQPGSKFSTNTIQAPVRDYVACMIIDQMANRMPSGYPASYNDLGKIWEVIKGVAKVALPALGTIFPQAMPITSLISGLL